MTKKYPVIWFMKVYRSNFLYLLLEGHWDEYKIQDIKYPVYYEEWDISKIKEKLWKLFRQDTTFLGNIKDTPLSLVCFKYDKNYGIKPGPLDIEGIIK